MLAGAEKICTKRIRLILLQVQIIRFPQIRRLHVAPPPPTVSKQKEIEIKNLLNLLNLQDFSSPNLEWLIHFVLDTLPTDCLANRIPCVTNSEIP